jgi:hypothetical protein
VIVGPSTSAVWFALWKVGPAEPTECEPSLRVSALEDGCDVVVVGDAHFVAESLEQSSGHGQCRCRRASEGLLARVGYLLFSRGL